MKVLLSVLSCLFVCGAFAQQPELGRQDCEEIAVNSSITAFSPDNQSIIYKAYDLVDEKGFKYIDSVRMNLKKDLMGYCEKSGQQRSVKGLMETHHKKCSSECQKQKDVFENKLFGAGKAKEKADGVCLHICNSAYEKMAFYEKGAKSQQEEVAKCQALKSSPEASVDGSLRSIAKEVLENSETSGDSSGSTVTKD